jgi:glycosyltransferase involved in cell wall biosynthesis
LIGVIGRFSPEKGHAVFLEAFNTVVRTLPKCKAVLIGEGPEMPALEAMVKAAGQGKHVKFAGYQTDMSSVYKALDLVVIPSLSEGLPNVLLEAFLHGKPVIATAVGGIPAVMQGVLSRCLVSPADPKALAEKILEVLKDSDLRTELSEAGNKNVETNFSVFQRGQKITQVYREALGFERA